MKLLWTKFLMLLSVVVVVAFSASAFAQQIPTDPDVAKLVSQLFTDWSSLGWLARGMIIVILLTQFLNWSLIDKLFMKTEVLKTVKKLIVYVLSLGYTVLFSVDQGTPAFQAVLMVLTAGGAMHIYDLLKPLFKKD